MTKQKAYVQFSKRIVLFGHYRSDSDFAAGDGAVLFPQRHGSAGQHGSDVHQLRDDCFRSVQRKLGVREVADAGEEQ